MLERKIVSSQAVLEDVLRFQELQDGRVKVLLGSSPESIFSLEIVERARGAFETPSVLLKCRGCGEPVLESRAVHFEGEAYCMPCFMTKRAGCASCWLH